MTYKAYYQTINHLLKNTFSFVLKYFYLKTNVKKLFHVHGCDSVFLGVDGEQFSHAVLPQFSEKLKLN